MICIEILTKEHSEAAKLTEELWLKYEKDLRIVCKARLRGHYQDNVDDCMQEIFLALFECLNSGKVIENPKGWLYTTARNKIVEILRQGKAKTKNEVYVSDLYDEEDSPQISHAVMETVVVPEEQIIESQKAIMRSLEDGERELMNDITIKHMKLSEISEKYGVSISLAKKRSANLKRKVKKLVKDLSIEGEPES